MNVGFVAFRKKYCTHHYRLFLVKCLTNDRLLLHQVGFMKRIIRDLIVGEDVYIASRTEFRQVMLSGQYAILALLVIAFYMALKILVAFTPPIKFFLIGFFSIFFSLVLLRPHLPTTPIYFFFPSFNF